MTITEDWRAVSLAEMRQASSPQGQCLTTAIAAQADVSVGFVYMPPGHRSVPHAHWNYDIIVVTLEGNAVTLVGEQLEDEVVHRPGDNILVPAGVPHVAINLSSEKRVVAVEFRADPTFNDDVEVLPHLIKRTDEAATHLQRRFVEPTDQRNILELL